MLVHDRVNQDLFVGNTSASDEPKRKQPLAVNATPGTLSLVET